MFNQVMFVGCFIKDFEFCYIFVGVVVVYVMFVVNCSFKNVLGEIEVDYVNCIFWRKIVENMVLYC